MNHMPNDASNESSPSNEAPQIFEHLVPRAREAAAQNGTTRIEIIRGDWVIRHAAVAQGLNVARWLLEGPRRTRTTGLLVTGPVGAGKTTLANLIKRSYPASADSDDEPIVMICMTGARHMRTVYGRILEALNGPVKATHHTADREMAALRLLRAVKCRGLIVDEVQDVLAGNVNEQRRTLDGLKYIMNEVQLPIIAMGTEGAAEAFRSDKHMDKRFDRLVLPTWSVGPELAALLTSVARILPLRRPSHLATKDIMELLVDETDGSLHDMMTLVRHAAVEAILSGSECITLGDLQAARAIPNMEAIDHVDDDL
ncbi:TniB family NTP-binding protein [Dyella sp. ASV21]|uniref:TniB family NTP-binding protein n=1 Tax=Dyella sp. ASV21 TaxID=2795114 RepID=UPI0018EDB8F9|nr:TniB family NTP-binding protein [Dyella sp. ASV21]